MFLHRPSEHGLRKRSRRENASRSLSAKTAAGKTWCWADWCTCEKKDKRFINDDWLLGDTLVKFCPTSQLMIEASSCPPVNSLTLLHGLSIFKSPPSFQTFTMDCCQIDKHNKISWAWKCWWAGYTHSIPKVWPVFQVGLWTQINPHLK